MLVSFVAIAFNLARLDIWGTTSLSYLTWNLFLAWIPYIISLNFIKKETSIKVFIPVFIVWILFLPNAPYLVTDVLHLVLSSPQMLWYDSILLFFFGWIGLLLGILSLLHIHRYMRNHFNKINSEIAIFIICFISSFGVYLGRFERFNSWDIFIRPINTMRHSVDISNDFIHDRTPLLFMIIFTIFFYSIYKTIYYLTIEKE